jgi:hypothetical protein
MSIETDRQQAEALLLAACVAIAYHASRCSDGDLSSEAIIKHAIREGYILKTALLEILPK